MQSVPITTNVQIPLRRGVLDTTLYTYSLGISTFIVPKVPTIVRGNAEYNSWYRRDNKSAITRISNLEVFYYTEQLCNSKF